MSIKRRCDMKEMMYAGVIRNSADAAALKAFCRAEMERQAAMDAAGLEDVRQLLAAQKARSETVERRRNEMLREQLRKIRRQVLKPKRSRIKAALLIGWAVLTVLLPEWIRDHRRTVDRVIYWSALGITTVLTAVAILEAGIVWGWWM